MDAAVAAEALVLLTALIFARAAMAKLQDPLAFAGVVANYDLLPRPVAGGVARLIPLSEAALVALLLTPTTRGAGALAAGGLLLLFAVAITLNLLRGRSDIDCGCGDPSKRQPLRWAMVARNTALAAGLALTLGAARPLTAAGWGVALAGALAGLILYMAHEALLSIPHDARRGSDGIGRRLRGRLGDART